MVVSCLSGCQGKLQQSMAAYALEKRNWRYGTQSTDATKASPLVRVCQVEQSAWLLVAARQRLGIIRRRQDTQVGPLCPVQRRGRLIHIDIELPAPPPPRVTPVRQRADGLRLREQPHGAVRHSRLVPQAHAGALCLYRPPATPPDSGAAKQLVPVPTSSRQEVIDSID